MSSSSVIGQYIPLILLITLAVVLIQLAKKSRTKEVDQYNKKQLNQSGLLSLNIRFRSFSINALYESRWCATRLYGLSSKYLCITLQAIFSMVCYNSILYYIVFIFFVSSNIEQPIT